MGASQVRGSRRQSLVSLVAQESTGTIAAATSSAGATSSWVPTFFAPQLTPLQFLIISSPTQHKVVYTQLKNFKSTYGRTYPLIDSGLLEPAGIDFDRDRGFLYVADRAAQKIYRYGVVMREEYDRDRVKHYVLAIEGNRLTVVDGCQAEWVTVNPNGDVFYSDIGSNSINKISMTTMASLGDGVFEASQLQVVSEKQLEAMSAASTASQLGPNTMQVPTDSPPPQANILSLYEGSMNQHVSTPGGIFSDGLRLYWTNGASGTTAGAVLQGEVTPKSPPTLVSGGSPAPFPTNMLSNASGTGFGVCKSNDLVFFAGLDSTASAGANTGAVYGVSGNGGPTMPFAIGLGSPRGVCWDGDNTVYVADEAQDTVWSFPSGRHMENAPLTKTVEFAGAYGIAMLTKEDILFMLKAGAWGPSAFGGRLLSAIATVFAVLHMSP